jgi:hypothetical protein
MKKSLSYTKIHARHSLVSARYDVTSVKSDRRNKNTYNLASIDLQKDPKNGKMGNRENNCLIWNSCFIQKFVGYDKLS